MSRTIKVLVMDKRTNDFSHLFEFPYEEGDKNPYKAITSINSFFSSSKFDSENSNYIFIRGESFLSRATPPAITPLPSVWEFYKVIGLDYKTKQWTRTSILLPT
jgi:hypothetical protein